MLSIGQSQHTSGKSRVNTRQCSFAGIVLMQAAYEIEPTDTDKVCTYAWSILMASIQQHVATGRDVQEQSQ